ncbi:hypothetical protein OMA37_000512 [Vibrio fluvialis]|nr:hypothetical protein [Vibrio fluvialis]
MLSTIIISGLTFIAVIATLIFSVWTFVDTKRRYSHQQFLKNIEQDRIEADKRFKKRTRLGKSD